MKTTQTFFFKRQEVQIWFEEVNGKLDFWRKNTNSSSHSISEKQYIQLVTRHGLKNLLSEYK